jgi:phosphate-selective porin OprO/OprP
MPAYATNEAVMDLLKILKDKGSITNSEYEVLRNTAMADVEKTEKNTAEAIAATTEDLPEINTKDKLVIESRDGNFKWQPIGRIMADYNFVNSDKAEYGSGAELRRARLGMEMTLWKHWIGKIEYDFGGDEVSAKDAYVGYKNSADFGKWWIKVGNQHIPFGFSTLSSSKYMTFISRPQYADGPVQPARQLGVAAFAGGDRWNFHTGAFMGKAGEDPDECLVPGGECDEQISWAARATGIPFMSDNNHLLALGAGVWLRDTGGSTIDIDQRVAGTHTTDYKPFNMDFEGNKASNTTAYNVDVVGIFGRFHAKAEYVAMTVEQNGLESGIAGDYNIDGWSVDAGVFLTGESKSYDRAKAQFGSIKPNRIVGQGGIGAWELGIRYEKMDLNDTGVALYGGAGELLTIGLNWYVNNTMRFMANYAQVMDYREPGSADDGDEPGAFLFRGQVYW